MGWLGGERSSGWLLFSPYICQVGMGENKGKNISFEVCYSRIRFKINQHLNFKFLKNIYCQFGLFNDENIIKTKVVKKSDNIDFKFSQQFDTIVTREVYLLEYQNIFEILNFFVSLAFGKFIE